MNTLTIVFSLCIISVYAIDQDFITQFKVKLLKIGNECILENKVGNDEAADLRHFKLPTTHAGKCAVFCFNKRLNIQKEDGSVDKAGILSSTETVKANDAELHGKFVEAFNACADSVAVDSDPCNTASAFLDCSRKESSARGVSASLFD